MIYENCETKRLCTVNAAVARTNKRKLTELILWWIFYEQKWKHWAVWRRWRRRRRRRRQRITSGTIGCMQFSQIVSRTMWVFCSDAARARLLIHYSFSSNYIYFFFKVYWTIGSTIAAVFIVTVYMFWFRWMNKGKFVSDRLSSDYNFNDFLVFNCHRIFVVIIIIGGMIAIKQRVAVITVCVVCAWLVNIDCHSGRRFFSALFFVQISKVLAFAIAYLSKLAISDMTAKWNSFCFLRSCVRRSVATALPSPSNREGAQSLLATAIKFKKTTHSLR